MTNNWKKLILWLANRAAEEMPEDDFDRKQLDFLIAECENDVLHPGLEDVEQ